MEESRILLWHRDKLKLSIITDQFLQAVFDHILGRDVVKKLMQVHFFYLLHSRGVSNIKYLDYIKHRFSLCIIAMWKNTTKKFIFLIKHSLCYIVFSLEIEKLFIKSINRKSKLYIIYYIFNLR